MIVRTLAGAVGKERPLFLKIVYHGPAAMEQLAGYDSRLIVGVLGGSSGTTYDAFHQLWEAKKYGARVALYGRMINNAEHQLTFIEHLRKLADGVIEPLEAVRSYHAALQRLKIRPYRRLDDDLQQTQRGQRLWRFASGRRRREARRRPQSARREYARLLQDDPGGKARLEPGSLETHSGLARRSADAQDEEGAGGTNC